MNTDGAPLGHSTDVPLGSSVSRAHDEDAMSSRLDADAAICARARPRGIAPAQDELVFEEVYDAHFAFVWRSVRRLGVDASAVDDAVQEIFVVVHRRLPEFEARASVKTWLFGIVLRVVRQYRRTLRRKPAQLGGAPTDPDVDRVIDAPERSPHEQLAKAEAVRMLHAVLDTLDDEKREVLVLAELEQMTVPEIADVLEANVNTVYSRLRAARRDFELAIARQHARDRWRGT